MTTRIMLSAVALCLVLGACSRLNTSSDLDARSQVVLNSPPDVFLTGAINNWGYLASEGATTIAFSDRSGVHDDETMGVSGNTLLLLDVRLKGGTEYLLAGTLDAAENFSLYRYHDSTGDGVPDGSTQTLLFSSSEPMYVTDVTQTDAGTMYLLDRRCQDVLVAVDTGADGWADQINTTPYARSADYPRLLDMRSIRVTSQNKLLAMSKEGLDQLRMPHAIFSDTNADLVSDVYTHGPIGDKSIHYAEFPVIGQTAVTARAEPGQTVEVWELNATGGTVTVLGSGVVSTGGDVTIPLSRALVSGEPIGLKYSTESTVEIQITVVALFPQVQGLEPTTVPTGQTSTVDVTGRNFTPNTVFKLFEADGTGHTLSSTYNDTTSVTVTIPNLTDEGTVTIHAEEPSLDPDVVGASGQSLLVCEPE